MTEEIKQFIENHVDKTKKLSKRLRASYWNAQVTGEDKYYKETEKLSKQLQEIYNNKKDFEIVKGFNESKIKDVFLKRQVKLLYDDFLSCQGDLKLLHELTEIENKEMTDNEIKELLKKETDSEKLQKAWEASKKQAEIVIDELMVIIKLRNKLAKSLGFTDYYEMALEMQEQSKKDIIKLFNE